MSRTAGRAGGVACAVIAVMCLAALWTRPLQAEPNAEENCEDRKSTTDIVECLAIQTAVWERRLNAVYQKLMEELPARRRELAVPGPPNDRRRAAGVRRSGQRRVRADGGDGPDHELRAAGVSVRPSLR